MQLVEALNFHRGDMAALIGAGGKTTTMFRLARELREKGWKVLVTTTTKIFKPSKPHIDRLFLVDDLEALAHACGAIAAPVVIGAGASVSEDGKLLGLPAPWLDRLNDGKSFDAILVEADGAASRLLKVPGEGEPVIPARCKLTVWLMSIGVLGKPLDAAWIHRVEVATALLACPPGNTIDEERIVQLIKHRAGCWKGIPPASRRVAVINQVDSPEDIPPAVSLGKKLLACGAGRVVLTSYKNEDPVREVLLQ
ncbi:MAG: putative selenium-dependent hydroxylase accessory protein YqeC [Deltaproteobacteria bacterium]|nr:putative selenium-dependent hydroxylase accessory protein YqeC [Deltaproteobacteria bacterium]